MSNNTVDLKFRRRFLESFTFQSFASMRFGFSREMQDNSRSLLTVFQPEKMVFALTHESSSDDKMHKVKPFMGV